MTRSHLILGSLLGGLAVVAGAFGAHALADHLDERAMAIWDLASRYQLVHAVVIVMLGFAAPRKGWTVAGWLFVTGVVVFSGSLYLLAVTHIRWLGAITPIGGVSLIAGWATIFIAALRSR